MSVEDQPGEVRVMLKPGKNGEGAGPMPVQSTKMVVRRARRGSGSISGHPGERHIYAVAASAKQRAELTLLAAASTQAVWQEFTAGQEFLRAAASLNSGCVLLFDPLPDIETLAIVSWLGQQRPDLGSIVISGQPTVKAAVDCLKAGAADFLGSPLDRAVAAEAMQAIFEPGPERPSRASALARLKLTSTLSQRELQVLEGLLAGDSNKAVGANLHISERTVEVHRSRIMRRLNVDSFAELVRMSVRAGIGSA